MRPSDFIRKPCTLLAGAMMALAIHLLAPAPLSAADPAEPGNQPAPIRISADRLVSDSNNNQAEFSGNVKVVQGRTTITAERLKLIYLSGGSQAEGIDTGDIETLEAYGNVRIEFDNRVAVGQKAVYSTVERKLILTGPGAKVTLDTDTVEGDRITFYRDDGRVEIQGGVKAKIRSEQRGLN